MKRWLCEYEWGLSGVNHQLVNQTLPQDVFQVIEVYYKINVNTSLLSLTDPLL
jgi:hypothetical protein